MATDFSSSELGSLDHWQKAYQRELDNYKQIGDEGEVWFGQDASEEMVDWCINHVPPTPDLTVLDVGMGNGQLCFAMNEAGYKNVTGVDYADLSVKLADTIADHKNVDRSQVKFEQMDVIQESSDSDDGTNKKKWDLVLDKGTYDAISLSDEKLDGKPLRDWYPVRVSQRMTSKATLLITSCNFTRDELVAKFVSPGSGLEYMDEIKRPAFEFGGKKGQTITTVAFRKKA